jgi:hypothetical protein
MKRIIVVVASTALSIGVAQAQHYYDGEPHAVSAEHYFAPSLHHPHHGYWMRRWDNWIDYDHASPCPWPYFYGDDGACYDLGF